MTLRHLILRLLAVAVVMTVTAIGGLGWFNWWIRNTWMPIAPLCFDGDEVVQLTEPLTPEAKELYLRYIPRMRDIFTEKDRAERATYARVVGDQAYVRTWYGGGSVRLDSLAALLSYPPVHDHAANALVVTMAGTARLEG